MKHSYHVITAISAFVLGVAAVSAWLFFRYTSKQNIVTQQTEDLVTPPKEKIDFYFFECAGKKSVFLLENLTNHSIYTRVPRTVFRKKSKNATSEFGLDLIKYKAPEMVNFEYVVRRGGVVAPFREISPNSKVKYDIDLRQIQGEYIVTVLYIEDAEVARQINKDSDYGMKQKNLDRFFALWKEVDSDIVTNRCQ